MTTKKKNRVLAIDDEPSIIEWLKILLEHQGYEVRTAMIGTRGEEIFKTWKPDVVITDMMLPDIDGLELLRHLKSDPTTAEIPVVVVSADALASQIEAAMQAGAFHYLTKPVSVAELLSVVDSVLEGAETRFG